jgi:flavin-dependent dehydrogenase
MRRKDPLIIGAGPAGSAAAITLALGGAKPLLLDRATETGDALCGGFLSWETLRALDALGVAIRGHPITHLHVFAGDRIAHTALPETAMGLSRRALDTALLNRARALGAGLERGTMVRSLEEVRCRSDALFLATGKHDIIGSVRPRVQADPTIGLRVRLPASPALTREIGNAIELHLFNRGYAGVDLQEDGSANICLAVRKSLLAEADRNPHQLLQRLGHVSPRFGARLEGLSDTTKIDAIAAIPYGWRVLKGQHGLFRLGDQCAVIPSLAGEGIGIALASGSSAARAFLDAGGDAASRWQQQFSRQSARPLTLASALWRMGEIPSMAAAATLALRLLPGLATLVARATRITT